MKRGGTSARTRIVMAWLALLALLAATATLAHLHLGMGNLVAGLGIAAIKVVIVAWVFMGLRGAGRSVRLCAAIAAALLAILAILAGLDIGARPAGTAPWQPPEQIAPRLHQDHNGSPS